MKASYEFKIAMAMLGFALAFFLPAPYHWGGVALAILAAVWRGE